MRFAIEGENGHGDGGVEWQPRTPTERFLQNSYLRQTVMTPAVVVEGVPYADSTPEGYIRPAQPVDIDGQDLPA
jgi:hypothetical protein